MIVWIASYPRSGNTFLRVIFNTVFNIQTYSIYNDVIDIGNDSSTAEIVGHQFLPEDFDISSARDDENTYYIKTHELPDGRVNSLDKVIYLLRDGRESVLSYFNYAKEYADPSRTMDDTIYGNVFSGSWGRHVEQWDPAHRENTLLIKFEELIDDPETHIKRISEFLSIQPVGHDVPVFDELHKINPKFFRSGKKDSWQSVYSFDEHLAFWLKNHAQMIEYGYTNNMPEMVKDNDSFELFRSISRENGYLLGKITRLQRMHGNAYKSIRKIEMVEKLDDDLAAITNRLKRIEDKYSESQARIDDYFTIIDKMDKQAHRLRSSLKSKNDELRAIRATKAFRFSEFISRILRK